MAISTPAQKPRGWASRTRSTGTTPGYGPPGRTLEAISPPRVVADAPDSPAARAGVLPGDELVSMNGQVPRDVIQYRLLADEPDLELVLGRGGLELTAMVEKDEGQLLGVEVSSAL